MTSRSLTAADLKHGLLAYAAGEEDAIAHRIAHAGKTVEIVPMKLAGDIDSLLAEINRLAARVKQLAREAPAGP